MRYIKDIPNNTYKMGLFQWNGKYIIKIEAAGRFEQIYKLDETDFSGVEELEAVLDKEMLSDVSSNFESMHRAIQSSLERNDVLI